MVDRHPLIVNSDAKQIQELPTGDYLYGSIPLGGIIMWSGNNDGTSVPTGWTLCDGNGGQLVNGIAIPNLVNQFIIGAKEVDSGSWKSNVETGTYAGSQTLKQSGGFKNAVLISHEHDVLTGTAGGSGGGFVSDRDSESAGSNGPDTVSIQTTGLSQNNSASTTQTGCDANLPPYYSLAYIIRTT
mgnify:CR=1 FL=1|tara:strand:+ start:103 stop:657 length:555 start_codon:yes stop_codon:yes gene_type:complete